LLCIAAFTLTAQSPTPRITLTDVTRAAGITARHDNGAAGRKLLPETMGAGAAFLDYDNDADQDLLIVNGLFPGGGGGRYATLYRNDGTGAFSDVSAQVGLQPGAGRPVGPAVPARPASVPSPGPRSESGPYLAIRTSGEGRTAPAAHRTCP
jgi:hypothetical protein